MSELTLRTRVVELLRQVPEETKIPYTFDEAFKLAKAELESLFHVHAPVQEQSGGNGGTRERSRSPRRQPLGAFAQRQSQHNSKASKGDSKGAQKGR